MFTSFGFTFNWVSILGLVRIELSAFVGLSIVEDELGFCFGDADGLGGNL